MRERRWRVRGLFGPPNERFITMRPSEGGMVWRSVIGLVVVAGCSTGQRPGAPPPPLPPPTRALVAWSGTVCTIVGSIDGLRARSASVSRGAGGPAAAGAYLGRAPAELAELRRGLNAVLPAGVKAADAYVTGLAGTLNGLASKLPDQSGRALSDGRKLARARKVAQVIATIKPQAKPLADIARANRTLTASYDLAPHCVPVERPAASRATRALVVWSDTVCDNAKALDALRGQRPEDVLSGDPRFARAELHRYVTSAAPRLSAVERGLTSVPPAGVKEADDYRASLLSAIRRALPELRRRDPSVDDHTLPAADEVARTLATIKPGVRDLAGIAARSPRLRPSYDLAPNCDPV